MAIQLDLTTSQFGIPFTGAYFRIVTASVSRQRSDADHKHSVMIDVVGYATVPENDNTKEIDFRRYHTSYEEIEAQTGENFIAKCYAWTMAQPDMNNSQSV